MRPKKILVVEDDELDVISVNRSLKKLEVTYQFYSAHNGREALAMLNNIEDPVEPDVILLDLNMPKMNGIEFLTALRADARFKDTRVFIMTTSSESADRAHAEKLGISGYILKPLSYTDNTKRADSMDAFIQFHLRKILSES